MTTTTRHMNCAICGAYAGRWKQHPNRDTGWGLCRKCADWSADPAVRGRHVSTPLEMADLYGLPGINYEPRYFRLHGLDFAIVAEYPDTEQGTADANAFMERHRNTGLLAVEAGRVILADLEDKGRQPAPAAQAVADPA